MPQGITSSVNVIYRRGQRSCWLVEAGSGSRYAVTHLHSCRSLASSAGPWAAGMMGRLWCKWYAFEESSESSLKLETLLKLFEAETLYQQGVQARDESICL